MIQANEIRVGNAVYDHDGVLRWINHRKISDIASRPNDHGYMPIPLTEEWLLKFGFEEYRFYKDRISYKLVQERGGDYFVTGEWFHKCLSEGNAVILNYNLQYVHQLQNLFFALTGKELELKKEGV